MKTDAQIQHTKKFFDSIHDEYGDKAQLFLQSLEHFRRLSNPYIRGSVLDIGNGGIISFNIEKAKKIILADISTDMFHHLQRVYRGRFQTIRRTKKMKCMAADVRHLPFRSEFDTVLLLTTAHHLSEKSVTKTQQNIQQAFREIHRVLAKDGRLLILECQLWGPFKLIQDTFFEPAFRLLLHFHKPLPYFMSEAQIKNYLADAGFTVEKVTWIPSGEKVYIPLFPFLTFPGKLWDHFSKSHFFVARKITSARRKSHPSRST